MAKVQLGITAINCGKFFRGIISVVKDGCSEIKYEWVCTDPFKKNPGLNFYYNGNLVFRLENEVTPKFEEGLTSWQKAILSFKRNIYNIIVYSKRENKQYVSLNEEIEFKEKLLDALVS